MPEQHEVQHPEVQHPEVQHQEEGRSAAAMWVALLPRLLARTALMAIGGMLFWAVLPALFGWHATTVMSDSMAPRLLRGDIVVSIPVSGDHVAVGQVALFDDPDHPGRLRMHRVVKIEDGLITTKGDANPAADSTPVRPSAVHGVGVLRVPYLGYPIVWIHDGELLPLAATGTALAIAVCLAFPAARRRGGNGTAAGDDSGEDAHSDRHTPRRRNRHGRRRARPARATHPATGSIGLGLGLLAAVAAGSLVFAAAGTPAHSSFSSTVTTAASGLSAASSFGTSGQAATTVTAAQLGISPANGGTTVIDASVPLDASGTILSPYQPCVTVHIGSASGSTAWQVKIKSTLPPYNSAPVSAWSFQQNGAYTGRLVSGPDANGYLYVSGAENTSPAHPFGSTDWSSNPGNVANTPVGPGQTATLYFCVSVTAAMTPPVLSATDASTGATNYTVSAPTLTGAGGSGAPSQYYACASVTLTGAYPHFWIGWRFSVDWTALVQSAKSSGQISADTASALSAKSLGSEWDLSGGGPASGTTEAHPATTGHTVYDVSFAAVGQGSVTNGTTLTVVGCTQ